MLPSPSPSMLHFESSSVTHRPVDDYEQIEAGRQQDPDDPAWHLAAARQAHCDSSFALNSLTDRVSC